jgi:hypothetical protein
MQQEKGMFEYESRSRSIRVPKYGIVILCTIAVGIGTAAYLYNRRNVWAMESIGEQFRPEIKKALDKNDLNQASRILGASWIFAKEIEYVKGNTPSDTGKEVVGTGLMTINEFRNKMEEAILNPDQPFGAIDDRSYSSILSSVLTQEELKKLDQIRNKYGYWSKLKDSLAFQPQTAEASETDKDYGASVGYPVGHPNRSDGRTIKFKKLPLSQNLLELARSSGEFLGKIAALNDQKELDRELIVKRFVEVYGYDKAHSESLEFCVASTMGKQYYRWPRRTR